MLATSCGSGDNSSVRAFHPTVRPDVPLVKAVLDGEKAQKPDIAYSVNGRDCSGAQVRVGREGEERYIRISEVPPDKERPWAQPYREVGYATDAAFELGLAETLPQFYSCKAFQFTFGRYQGWPASDSFSVTVDARGLIRTVSPLERND